MLPPRIASVLALTFVATRGDAQPDTLKQIVPGVWFRQGDIDHKGHCNNVIIEMADHLIVVDANFPSGARLVLEDAKRVSSKPVKFVFDTHHHGDHLYGNPVWTSMGAVTVAYAGVAEEIKRYEPKRWKQAAGEREDVRELKRDAPEAPMKTFTQSPYVMEDSTRRVELHFFGWAHTRGDGFAWLPNEKVLATGDAVTNGAYNYTADANVGNWPRVLAQAAKLQPRYVLPGHGAAGGKELIEGQSRFFVELRKAVEQAARSGKKPDEIAASIRLSDAVKNWVGSGLKAQVADAYREVTLNKPAGDVQH